MPAPRKYDPQVLRRVVELVKRSKRPVARIAAELGIGAASLRKAVRVAEAETGERPDLPTKQELEEIRRLKRENDELRRTDEVLKLVSACFAQELDPVRCGGTWR